jgi:hypothetical protein
MFTPLSDVEMGRTYTWLERAWWKVFLPRFLFLPLKFNLSLFMYLPVSFEEGRSFTVA